MSKKIMGLTLLFSEDAFRGLTELPMVLNYGGCAVIGLGLAMFAFIYRRYPNRFKPYRKDLQWIFGETFDSLWTFLFRSLLGIFWTIDLVVITLYWHWAVWVMLAVQASVIISMLEWKFEWNLQMRPLSFIWQRIRYR